MRLRYILPAVIQIRGIYYYNTYDNHQISAVDMYKADLDGEKLYTYAPIKGEQIRMQN